jgi:membrane-associated protease RseP (regulator of RpoE activity)
MATKPSFRLAHAVLVFLLFLLPTMWLVGAAEGVGGRPTLVFWLLLILPLLILPWLLSCCEPEETTNGHKAAARKVQHDSAIGDRFASLVAPQIDVQRSYVEQGMPVAEGMLRAGSTHAFRELEKRLAPWHVTPLLESLGGKAVRVLGLPAVVEERLRGGSSPGINILLFLATLATTVFAGAMHRGVNLLQDPARFAVGLPYAVALLAILGVHEMGHYVVARWHGVRVTLPYFIPVAMGLGTFGAFIQIKSLIKSRRAVFDVGIAGPLAGLLVALPALYFGLQYTQVVPTNAAAGMQTGSSLLLALMYQLVHGGDLGTATVRLSPVAHAGWIGLFVTALNLMPVGQLDGGHIAYGLFGRRYARAIGIGSVLVMIGLGLSVWPGVLTWALLITLLAGFSHMPALDDVTPPDGRRFALAALALVVLLLIIVPVPGALQEITLDSPYQ